MVIVGLIGLTIARFIAGLDWMYKADAITALVVALIVIDISGKLGWQTISALLDTAPTGLADKVGMVAAPVNGVVDTQAVPIRPSSAHMFIDMHVTMDGNSTLNDTHASTEVNEKANPWHPLARRYHRPCGTGKNTGTPDEEANMEDKEIE